MSAVDVYFERNNVYGTDWVKKFSSRASKVVADVLENRDVKDTKLWVNVYVPSMGIMSVPLYELLQDPQWRNDVHADKRAQCKVLQDTYLAAPIYDALQKMAAEK